MNETKCQDCSSPDAREGPGFISQELEVLCQDCFVKRAMFVYNRRLGGLEKNINFPLWVFVWLIWRQLRGKPTPKRFPLRKNIYLSQLRGAAAGDADAFDRPGIPWYKLLRNNFNGRRR